MCNVEEYTQNPYKRKRHQNINEEKLLDFNAITKQFLANCLI